MVNINDQALNFKAQALVNKEETTIELSDFKGKKIALYFYPKDLTPGCTFQAENIRDNFKELENSNIVVIGVSKDPIKLHQRFQEKKELPFILVSDESLEVNKLYNVWQLKKFMGREFMGTVRTTFLINEDFKIKDIIEKPKVKEHSKEILDRFR